MQHDHVLKKCSFDILTQWVRGGSAGKIFATVLLHFLIPFNLINFAILQRDHVLKKLIFDLFTPSQGFGRGRGSAGKIIATMLLYS